MQEPGIIGSIESREVTFAAACLLPTYLPVELTRHLVIDGPIEIGSLSLRYDERRRPSLVQHDLHDLKGNTGKRETRVKRRSGTSSLLLNPNSLLPLSLLILTRATSESDSSDGPP